MRGAAALAIGAGWRIGRGGARSHRGVKLALNPKTLQADKPSGRNRSNPPDPPERTPVSIHPLAVVNPEARLGVGVTVGPFATIEAGAELGDFCTVASGAVIKAGVIAGCHN